MRNKLLAMALLATSTIFAADFSVGVRIGPPPSPRVARYRPAAPGPGFVWVDGYWYPNGRRYRWHEGYWTRPPYAGATWFGPRYENGQFFEGRWGGERGDFRHDHRWDRDRDRDWRDRGHDRNNDRDRDRH